MKPRDRSKARELALALLFQDHFQKHPPIEEAFTLLGNKQPQIRERALHIREEVRKRDRELEAIIEEYSKWRKERIDIIDRTILKMALYEMLYDPQVPPAVAIDEAVELTKRFSSATAYRFINGLLDRVRKEKMGDGNLVQDRHSG